MRIRIKNGTLGDFLNEILIQELINWSGSRAHFKLYTEMIV